MYYDFTIGYNGEWRDFYTFTQAGDYTLAMFGDYDGTILQDYVHVTVAEAEVPVDYLSVEHDTYAYSSDLVVNVTTNYSNSGAWVGLYNSTENNSIFILY